MTTLDQIRSHLVVSDRRHSSSVARQVRKGELVRVFRHVYVTRRLLAETASPQEFQTLVGRVRLLAVGLALDGRAVLSHESAASLWDIGLVTPPDSIHVTVTRRQGMAPTAVPELLVPGLGLTEGTQLSRHHTSLPEEHTVHWRGIRLTDRSTTAVQCAQNMPPRDALVVVSGTLRALTGFSRFRLEESRAAEATHRTSLHSMLEAQPNRRGIRRARAVISAADAGCESVPEAMLVWILRAYGFTVVTQVHHRVSTNEYWVDIELPELGIVIEFDGKGKYGWDRTTILRSLSERDARQKQLESPGLRVLRFEYRELFDPERVVQEILGVCAQGLRLRPIGLLLAP